MIFEKVSRLKLRFDSEKGNLLTEDLWDLPLTELNRMAKKLNKELSVADEEDFLQDENVEDIETRLKFDIVLHILNVKKDELKNRREAADKKIEKEKLVALLEEKQDEGLKDLSIDQIKRRIKKL